MHESQTERAAARIARLLARIFFSGVLEIGLRAGWEFEGALVRSFSQGECEKLQALSRVALRKLTPGGKDTYLIKVSKTSNNRT